MENQLKALAEYRIDEAQEAISDAKLLLDRQRYRAAANRIYYGAFYAALAMLLTKGLQYSKHSAVIAFFDKEFIKNGLLPREYSRALHRAFQERQDDDYMPFVTFDEQELTSLLHQVESMTEGIRTHVEKFVAK